MIENNEEIFDDYKNYGETINVEHDLYDCDDYGIDENEDCPDYIPDISDIYDEESENEYEGLSDELIQLVKENNNYPELAKKALMKEYVDILNDAIKAGARYGDGIIEKIKEEYQPKFEDLDFLIDKGITLEEKEKKVVTYKDYSQGYSIEEIYNDLVKEKNCC
jgi:hypothetical protein